MPGFTKPGMDKKETMKDLKPSVYNETIQDGDKKYIYNFYSGAIVEVDGGAQIETAGLSAEGAALLKEKGFLVDGGVDELRRLEFSYLAGKFDKSSLGLTLCTTLECNFSCPYCYEGKSKTGSAMSAEVIAGISDFVRMKLSDNSINTLYVNFLGGEALLRLDVLAAALDSLKAEAKKKNVTLNAGLVTNGYLLDEAMKTIDMPGDIQSLQVTFDGFGASHDRLRRPAGGGGSFERIFQNMVLALEKGVRVAARYNLTADNAADAMLLIDRLAGLEKKPLLYFGHVSAIGGADTCKSVACMSRMDYSKTDLELARYAASKGVKTDFMPAGKGNYCTADAVNGFTIDPQGYIYKCWSGVGKAELACGSVLAASPEECITDESRYYMYTMDNPFQGACSGCKLLPVCMGGCPVERRSGVKQCSKFKFQDMEFVKLYAEGFSK